MRALREVGIALGRRQRLAAPVSKVDDLDPVALFGPLLSYSSGLPRVDEDLGQLYVFVRVREGSDHYDAHEATIADT